MVGQKEMALVQGAVKYRTGASADELDNWPECHPHRLTYETHTELGEQRRAGPRRLTG
jgi:hypothetical protein